MSILLGLQSPAPPTDPFVGQDVARPWPRKSASMAVLTIAVSLLQSTLAPPVTAAPFSQPDWPVPQRAKARLFTQDQQPIRASVAVTALMGASSVAVPRPRLSASMSVLTIASPQQPMPADALRAHRQTDWPVPQARPVFLHGRTWNFSLPPDVLAATGTPFSQTDWPLPRRAPIRVSTQDQQPIRASVTVVQLMGGSSVAVPRLRLSSPPSQPDQNLLLTTLAVVDAGMPVGAQEYRLPALRRASMDLLTWTQDRKFYYEDAVPAHQTDWPVPTRRITPVGLLTWTYGHETALLPSSDAPFAQMDWPIPMRPRVIPHSWAMTLLQSTLTPISPCVCVQIIND